MPPTEKPGVLEAGTTALRNLVSNPLRRRKTDPNEFSREHGCATLGEDAINTIIESEIIPRLLLAHSAGSSTAPPDHKSEIALSEAHRFARLPLNTEAAGLLEEVDRFLAEGVSLDAIYIDLLAPAARRLGDMWSADECDFMDVTMGLWRLQEVMRDIAARTPKHASSFSAPRSILVASMPGDQHTFGAHMLEEVFAGAGWQSQLLPSPERREILDCLSHTPFDVATLTISRDCPSAALASLIKAMRGVSVNPHLSVIIGGNAVNNNPALVAEVGADGTGSDARAALLVADRLIMSAPVHACELR